MKLSTEQLNQIKAFIKKKGYSEPDIQMELLDHLACGIEERLPHSDFDKALRDTYKSFGIFGFSDFVDGINKAHQKAMQTKVWAFLKKCLHLPWLLVVLLSIYLVYSLTLVYTFTVPVTIVVISTVIFYYVYFRYFYSKERKYAKLSIVKSSNALSSGGLGATIATFQLWQYFNKVTNPHVLAAFSSLYVFSVLFLFVTSYLIKKYALERAEELENLYSGFE